MHRPFSSIYDHEDEKRAWLRPFSKELSTERGLL